MQHCLQEAVSLGACTTIWELLANGSNNVSKCWMWTLNQGQMVVHVVQSLRMSREQWCCINHREWWEEKASSNLPQKNSGRVCFHAKIQHARSDPFVLHNQWRNARLPLVMRGQSWSWKLRRGRSCKWLERKKKIWCLKYCVWSFRTQSHTPLRCIAAKMLLLGCPAKSKCLVLHVDVGE